MNWTPGKERAKGDSPAAGRCPAQGTWASTAAEMADAAEDRSEWDAVVTDGIELAPRDSERTTARGLGEHRGTVE